MLKSSLIFRGNSLKKEAFGLHFSRLPCGRDTRDSGSETQQRGWTSPSEEPGWRSASPAWRGHPGEPCHAMALAEPWEIEGNDCKKTREFLLVDGSMARELKIQHVGADTALSFIPPSTSDLQHSQQWRLHSSQKRGSQARIPNKFKYC